MGFMAKEAELILACHYPRTDDRLYWVDDEGIWVQPVDQDNTPTEDAFVGLQHGLTLDPGFVYFLDQGGDIRRVPREVDELPKQREPRYWVVKGSPRENDLEKML